jgi:hypothetical protein
MKRNFLSSVVLALLTASGLSADSEGARWFQLSQGSPVSLSFQHLMVGYLQEQAGIPVRVTATDARSLKDSLTQLAEDPSPGPILISTDPATYVQLASDPQMRRLFAQLDIELLNARLISFPLYLLGYRDRQGLTSGGNAGNLRIAFITLPVRTLHPVMDADVQTMLSELLGRPKNAIHILQERGAYPAAKGLYEGGYQVVAIYEDEPSVILHEFEINLTDELKAPPARFLDLDASKTGGMLVQVAPERLSYALFEEPESSSMQPAIAQELHHPFPLILSNVRTLSPETGRPLSAALSYACFLILPELQLQSETESERWKIEHMYLLNSYLNDPGNRFKGLGLLGCLMQQPDAASDGRRGKDFREAKCDLLREKLELGKITADSLLRWLGMKEPRMTRRELFTSDVSRLYQEGLRNIDLGLASEGFQRIRYLEEARTYLIAALMRADRPSRIKGSRGLWSVSDYNPYYQLGRVALYLEREGRRP